MKNISLFVILIMVCYSLNAQTMANRSYRMGNASVRIENNTLVVNTGKIERSWRWTDQGLLTTSVKDVTLGKSYPLVSNPLACDWNLPGAITETSKARLLSVDIREGNDEGFISDYIEVVTTVRYDSARIDLQYVVWVFQMHRG